MDTITAASGECIVHHRKYLCRFHQTMNQLRQLNQFDISILSQLPKRCCSCHGQTGESSFSIDHLRELCEQLQLSSKSPVKIPPKKEITDYMILKIDPVLTHRQRIYKFGRFIGQKGRHIALLQKKLNVRIDILNDKSSKNFRQIINKFQTSTKPNDMSSLSIIIIRKDKDQNIDQIKESIQQNWKQIDVTTRKKRSTTIRSAASLTDISLDGDTRWTAVKKSKGKRKEKRNEMIEQEDIQPQPTFRPISMPKELPNRRKTNRK